MKNETQHTSYPHLRWAIRRVIRTIIDGTATADGQHELLERAHDLLGALIRHDAAKRLQPPANEDEC